MLESASLHHRPDVVEQRPGDAIPARGGEQHRHEPAERGAEQDEAAELQLRDQRLDVLEVGQRHIGHRVLGVGAFAPAPELDADHPALSGEALGNPFEVARVSGQARNAKDRGAARRACIIAVVQPQAIVRQPIAIGP